MIADNLPALIVALPLVMAVIVSLLPNGRLAWGTAAITTAAVFAVSLANAAASHGQKISYALGGWPPPWGIEFVTDGASALMTIVLSGLSFVSTIYAKALFEKEIAPHNLARVYGAWLLMIGGLLGLVMTADAFNLFVFLEISSLSAVILVSMGADANRRALPAAYNYLIIGAIGATFYVTGVGFLYAVTGTLNMHDLAARLPEATLAPMFVGLAFMVAGIMTKAAMFPMHIWLPAAYGYSPSAVAVLLAAISTKASIYVLMRIFFTIFAGIDDVGVLILTWIIIPLSLAAIFFGTILAIFERDLRHLLAQSSIAQIGYITLGIGIGTKAGVSAAFIHITNHAMIKGGIFMAVGGLFYALQKRVTMTSIEGLGRAMPITSAALLICGLSLVGLPLTAGFISKVYLILATLDAGYFLITAMVVISSALSLVYIGKIIEAMFLRPAPDGFTASENPWIYLPLWAVALANIYFGVHAAPIVDMAMAAADAFMGGQP